MLWATFEDNFIVKTLSHRSLYMGIPGSSIMETTYPLTISWNNIWLPPNILTLYKENYFHDNSTWVMNAVSTDAFKFKIFGNETENVTCDDVENPVGPTDATTILQVRPGETTWLKAIACDQRNNPVRELSILSSTPKREIAHTNIKMIKRVFDKVHR